MLVVITVSLWLISVRATARSTDALSPAFDAGLESSVTTFDAKLTTQGIEPAVKATRPTRARIAQATLDTNGCTMCATAQCCEVTVASVNPECCDVTVASVNPECCDVTVASVNPECCDVTVASVNPECCDVTVASVNPECCDVTVASVNPECCEETVHVNPECVPVNTVWSTPCDPCTVERTTPCVPCTWECPETAKPWVWTCNGGPGCVAAREPQEQDVQKLALARQRRGLCDATLLALGVL